ncbi:hypothetical protein EAF04_010115 [Stromatinia cepivora]|nr:hypothetical protein EAF04_010115 [Stromatinia cepivora]
MGSDNSSEEYRTPEAIVLKLEELSKLYYDAGDIEVGRSLKRLAHSPNHANSLRTVLLEKTSFPEVEEHSTDGIRGPIHDPIVKLEQWLRSFITTDEKRLSDSQIRRIYHISRHWDRSSDDFDNSKVVLSRWRNEPSSFHGSLIALNERNNVDLLRLCFEQYEQIEDEQKLNPIRRRILLIIIFEIISKEEKKIRREQKMKKRVGGEVKEWGSAASCTLSLRSRAIDSLARRLYPQRVLDD